MIRSYTTRGAEKKKLLGDAMRASKQKHILKKRLRKIIFIEIDIPEDQVVDIVKDEEIIWTDSKEEASEKILDS